MESPTAQRDAPTERLSEELSEQNGSAAHQNGNGAHSNGNGHKPGNGALTKEHIPLSQEVSGNSDVALTLTEEMVKDGEGDFERVASVDINDDVWPTLKAVRELIVKRDLGHHYSLQHMCHAIGTMIENCVKGAEDVTEEDALRQLLSSHLTAEEQSSFIALALRKDLWDKNFSLNFGEDVVTTGYQGHGGFGVVVRAKRYMRDKSKNLIRDPEKPRWEVQGVNEDTGEEEVIKDAVGSVVEKVRAFKVQLGLADLGVRKRFRREDRNMKRAREVHKLVRLHSSKLGEHSGYLEEDFVPGYTLSEYLKLGPLPLHLGIKLCRMIAEPLAEIHEKVGIAHLDIKPENIIIEEHYNKDGSLAYFDIKILDFGLSKRSTGVTQQFTAANAVNCTEDYAAPEQCRFGNEIAWTDGQLQDQDTWQCGALFSKMLTGHIPNRLFDKSGKNRTMKNRGDNLLSEVDNHKAIDQLPFVPSRNTEKNKVQNDAAELIRGGMLDPGIIVYSDDAKENANHECDRLSMSEVAEGFRELEKRCAELCEPDGLEHNDVLRAGITPPAQTKDKANVLEEGVYRPLPSSIFPNVQAAFASLATGCTEPKEPEKQETATQVLSPQAQETFVRRWLPRLRLPAAIGVPMLVALGGLYLLITSAGKVEKKEGDFNQASLGAHLNGLTGQGPDPQGKLNQKSIVDPKGDVSKKNPEFPPKELGPSVIFLNGEGPDNFKGMVINPDAPEEPEQNMRGKFSLDREDGIHFYRDKEKTEHIGGEYILSADQHMQARGSSEFNYPIFVTEINSERGNALYVDDGGLYLIFPNNEVFATVKTFAGNSNKEYKHFLDVPPDHCIPWNEVRNHPAYKTIFGDLDPPAIEELVRGSEKGNSHKNYYGNPNTEKEVFDPNNLRAARSFYSGLEHALSAPVVEETPMVVREND